MDLPGNGGFDGVGKMGFRGRHTSDCHRSARGRDFWEVPFVVADAVDLSRTGSCILSWRGEEKHRIELDEVFRVTCCLFLGKFVAENGALVLVHQKIDIGLAGIDYLRKGAIQCACFIPRQFILGYSR